MEASFRSRLDRTFGFLNDANENGGDLHLWSVEERVASSTKLSREGDNSDDDDDDDDQVSGYADFLKSENKAKESRFFGEEDLEDLESGDEEEDDDEDEDEEDLMRVGKKKKPESEQQTEIEEVNTGSASEGVEAPKDDEEREVREMVGMDCTLDFEDEEDEYDKVAVGMEGFDDRLFMSQVRNFGASRQQLNPLPTSFIEMRQASRDRRANHKAALARLEEDNRQAAAKESSQTEKAEDQPVRQGSGGEAMDIDGDHGRAEVRNEALNLQSSLVREGKQQKSGKRVRFSVDETKSDALDMTCSPCIVYDRKLDLHSKPNRYSKVPDYVKNPSKYIHYTLDWSEEDEEQANTAAFHAARVVSTTTSSSTQDMVTEEALQGPSGSSKISFNPLVMVSKRSSKESGSKGVGTEGALSNGVVNVAANFDMDSNLGGLITMEDDQDLSTSNGLKSGRVVRRYRNRVTDED